MKDLTVLVNTHSLVLTPLVHEKHGTLLLLLCKHHTIQLTASVSCTSRKQTTVGHLRVFFSFIATGMAIQRMFCSAGFQLLIFPLVLKAQGRQNITGRTVSQALKQYYTRTGGTAKTEVISPPKVKGEQNILPLTCRPHHFSPFNHLHQSQLNRHGCLLQDTAANSTSHAKPLKDEGMLDGSFC